MSKIGKKIIVIVSIMFIISIMSIAISSRTLANDFTVSLNYGLNGNLRSGRYAPFTLNIENKADDEVKIEIEVKVRYGGNSHYIYKKEILAEKGELETHLLVPLINTTDRLKIKIITENGNIIYNEQVEIGGNNKEDNRLFIGILSKQVDSLSYFNNVELSNAGMKTRCIFMRSYDISSNARNLDMLDVLVMDSFNSSVYSEEQIAAIIEWVNNGGTLIIGTGEMLEPSLLAFKKHIKYKYSILTELETDMGIRGGNSITGINNIIIPYRRITLENGKVLFHSDNNPLITQLAHGEGSISVAGFSYRDIVEYVRYNGEYVELLLERTLGEEKLALLSAGLNNNNYKDYEGPTDLISIGNIRSMPNIAAYAIILAVYVLITGPILYTFLKKKNLGIYYPMGIAILSFSATFLIYFISQNTAFDNKLVSYAVINEIDSEVSTEIVFLNIRSPQNTEYSVDISGEYNIVPVVEDAFTMNNTIVNSQKITDKEPADMIVDLSDNAKHISIQNSLPFSPHIFKLERKVVGIQNILQAEVTLFEGILTGEITNSLSYDLKEVILIMDGRVMRIGDIKSGETINIEGQALIYQESYPNDIINNIINNTSYSQLNDDRTEVYNNISLESNADRRNILLYYMKLLALRNEKNIRLTAFVDTNIVNEVLADKESEIFGSSFVSFPLEVNFINENLIYYTKLETEPRIISGNYRRALNTLYGNDALTLEYHLGENIIIEKLLMNFLDKDIEYTYAVPFSGNIFFFNHVVQEYDLQDLNKIEFSNEELMPYLTPQNTLLVRYEIENELAEGVEMGLPALSVVGR
jgi:hypothetical protein